MERREYTPTKLTQTYHTTAQRHTPPPRATGELAMVREIENLRAQARQLEAHNRQMSVDVEGLLHEKQLNESKLREKGKLDQDLLAQYQTDKNQQIDLVKTQGQQDIAKLTQEYQEKVERLEADLRDKEARNGENSKLNVAAETESIELRKILEGLEGQIRTCRDRNSALSEEVTRQEFVNKKLEMLAQELERQKNDMEGEIHVLLDIEAEKSQQIVHLEERITESQASEASLHQKLSSLTDNFGSLEVLIAQMKEKLSLADFEGEQLHRKLHSCEVSIAEHQQMLAEQRQRQICLREEIQAHQERQTKRLAQVTTLMTQNEQVYRELTAVTHEVYEASIEKGIQQV